MMKKFAIKKEHLQGKQGGRKILTEDPIVRKNPAKEKEWKKKLQRAHTSFNWLKNIQK